MARQAMAAAGSAKTKPRRAKTAVVMIHGMGEQWPMETLRGFVQAAWTCDPEMVRRQPAPVYSKPDAITGSFELRRITTGPWDGQDRRRIDFFEFYWAHLMQGNTLSAVVSWLLRLLVRPRSRVPDRLVGGWIAGLGILAAAALVALLWALELSPAASVWVWLSPLLAFAAAQVSAQWLRPVVGDAARYLSPSPDNVGARQAIREAGVDLLAKLHASGQYDRVVVVGHSLGSVVGYDMLNYAWGRIAQAEFAASHPAGSAAMARLDALETAAGRLAARAAPAGAKSAYRTAQRAYFDELRKLKDAHGRPLWLVSDYVTLGCPLSASDVLLAKDAKDLAAKKELRDTPTSPPWLEKKTPPRFSYPMRGMTRTPHHAAVFAPTVWTNLYFPSRFGVFGDFISGPVAPQLGPGVRDVRVPIGGPRFRHMDYWREPQGNRPWIRALRRAINLRGHDEATLWGVHADADPVPAEALPETLTPAAVPRRRPAAREPPPPGSRSPG